MTRTLILGAGGHAHVVADILLRANEAGAATMPIGFLDDDPSLHENTILDLPVLGSIRQRDAIDHDAVVVNTGTIVGHNVILNTGCTVDHHNHIGDHAHVAPGVHLGGDVNVGEGALVGIGAAVLPQRTIGAWSTIGAGAVVTKDIPDQATAVGVPARVIRAIR